MSAPVKSPSKKVSVDKEHSLPSPKTVGGLAPGTARLAIDVFPVTGRIQAHGYTVESFRRAIGPDDHSERT